MQLIALAFLFCVLNSVEGECLAGNIRIEKFGKLTGGIRKALQEYLGGLLYKLNDDDDVAHYQVFGYDHNPEMWEYYVCYVQDQNDKKIHLRVELAANGTSHISTVSQNEFKAQYANCSQSVIE